ncbi:peptidoglycan-binding domain-containing protein [Runella aurantiaca]|uniref:Peptidoglycan-binding protein n=1 Tax=Runella aurantiaca TaxID=2282308 RepID=A0A369I1K2_9BACT|nr:peptidoglycan-binding domain-containing protein [Runella aurantiaca]RDB03671.1 peptidoglycan-binding protein [Runella aurantiaca]
MATGDEMIELAAKHLGEKYILGAVAPKDNANYTGPWDCAEFVSWCVYQVSGIKVGMRNNDAYTGYWKEDIATKCRTISIEQAKKVKGAVLLRFPNSAIGHIVFSDGNGKTIEAMDKNHGVTRGKINLRHWDVALLVNGILYDETQGTEPYTIPAVNFKVTVPIMTDPIVLLAKQALKNFGIDPGDMNDKYDKNMEIAIYNYQLTKGLITDGIMGKQTLKSLKLI